MAVLLPDEYTVLTADDFVLAIQSLVGNMSSEAILEVPNDPGRNRVAQLNQKLQTVSDSRLCCRPVPWSLCAGRDSRARWHHPASWGGHNS